MKWLSRLLRIIKQPALSLTDHGGGKRRSGFGGDHNAYFVPVERPVSQQSVSDYTNAVLRPRISNKPRGRRPDAVTAVMRGAYEVRLANGFTVRAMLSGRMMRHKIRFTALRRQLGGDKPAPKELWCERLAVNFNFFVR
jgi:hypothetical protein